jgi:hypothetical protein
MRSLTILCVSSCLAIPAWQAHAAVLTVTQFTDSASGGLAGTGAGVAGDLRRAILSANPGDTINFSCAAAPCTITLGGPLPPIAKNLTVDGGTYGNIVIDGAGLYRVFFVDSGVVLLKNLKIQNGAAIGGNAGGNGGGGAGLGGGLFVNSRSANVTLLNVFFFNCTAKGGNGGGGAPGGGAGGLAFAGGASGGGTDGGGGGGVQGAGANGQSGGGFNGGNGGAGGGGGGGSSTGSPGTGGAAYGANTAGSNGGNSAGGAGGAGGFGGGGGGSGFGGGGGAGGFGGGGGGGFITDGGGNGGVGGGGGGGGLTNPAGGGSGGAIAAGVGGGNGGSLCGGGGAAAGPAIFVNQGILFTYSSGASGSAATPGTIAGGCSIPVPTPGTSDSTPAFNYAGTVNGASAQRQRAWDQRRQFRSQPLHG